MAFRPFSPFINRKPWAAFLVGFAMTPMGGMFFLEQGAWGLFYFAANILLLASFVLFAHFGLFDLDIKTGLAVIEIIVAIWIAFHCKSIAARQLGHVPLQWYARWYFLVFLIFLPTIIRSLLWEPFNIPSRASLPNPKVGDHLFVSKYSFGYSKYSFPAAISLTNGRFFFTPPERGDVAVFKLPTDPSIDFIKRIVGLPGDRIQIKGGILHINGNPVERARAGEYSRKDPYTGDDVTVPQYKEILPNGVEYFILEETDQGLMDNTPVFNVPAGHYFALGDNRDASRDSRFLQDFGYVPVENLVGRLSFRYWNSEDKKLLFLD